MSHGIVNKRGGKELESDGKKKRKEKQENGEKGKEKRLRFRRWELILNMLWLYASISSMLFQLRMNLVGENVKSGTEKRKKVLGWRKKNKV